MSKAFNINKNVQGNNFRKYTIKLSLIKKAVQSENLNAVSSRNVN